MAMASRRKRSASVRRSVEPVSDGADPIDAASSLAAAAEAAAADAAEAEAEVDAAEEDDKEVEEGEDDEAPVAAAASVSSATAFASASVCLSTTMPRWCNTDAMSASYSRCMRSSLVHRGGVWVRWKEGQMRS